MHKKFGAKTPFEYDDKQDQLWDWVVNYGQGIMGFYGDIPPIECTDFCLSQYHRFNVPLPSCIHSIIREGAFLALHYVDVVDPYVLLQGISDVDIVDDWCLHAYEVYEGDYSISEPSPEYVETYVARPGQADGVFNNIMSHPGLDALPGNAGSAIRGLICGTHDYAYHMEEPAWDRLSGVERDELARICRNPDGTVNETKFNAYFELAGWAAFAWIAGPLSREFRGIHHEVMAVAMAHGECIMVEGCIIAPTHYRKLARPPQSCHRCGIAAWCVEMTMTLGSTNYMCEHCLSEGMPQLSKMASCGSKFCTLSECPNHPYHHMGMEGSRRARAEFGQLGAMARGESEIRVMGQESVKQLEGR